MPFKLFRIGFGFFPDFYFFRILGVIGRSGIGRSDLLNRFLFGSITGLDSSDVLRQAIAAAIALVGVVVLYRAFLVMTFDVSLASMLGLRPGLAHAALLALLAISIVSSFQSVGNLLVFAFLVAPPAAATLLVRRVPMIMVVSVLLGVLATVVGILVSYHHATAAGATMALASVVIFFLVLAGTVVRRGIGQRRSLTTA